VVRVSGNRREVSVISALTPKGRLWFRCFRGTLNAERFIEFLEDLQQEFTKRLVLVVDKHPAHVAAATRDYLQTVRRRLSVDFLPSYAPELNPDEHVWSYLKWMLRSDPLREGEKIDDKVSDNMRHIQALPAFVRRFFRDPNVRYIKEALGW
jgi:transposase